MGWRQLVRDRVSCVGGDPGIFWITFADVRSDRPMCGAISWREAVPDDLRSPFRDGPEKGATAVLGKDAFTRRAAAEKAIQVGCRW
jgi:hypothetical protein